jgi:hypothetical protein
MPLQYCAEPGMSIDDSASEASSLSPTLAALATQLRDGPLQHLKELQRDASELASRLAASPADGLDDVEQLVRLSLAAMEHFQAFTREFAVVVRELSDARREPH